MMHRLKDAIHALNALRARCLSLPLPERDIVLTDIEITVILDMLESAREAPEPDRAEEDPWRSEVGRRMAELERNQRVHAGHLHELKLAYRKLKRFSPSARIDPPPERVPPKHPTSGGEK